MHYVIKGTGKEVTFWRWWPTSFEGCQGSHRVGGFGRSDEFRDAAVIWFIDSSVALVGLVKGDNQGVEMDRGCAVVYLALVRLIENVWWEYVEFESTWSDGASRVG